MKKSIAVGLIGLVAFAAFVVAQEVPKYISGGQIVANFQKGGPYGGSYTGGTFLVYSSEPNYRALVATAGTAVQASNPTYTATVAKAASAVQPTDATYTATVAKAASALQVELDPIWGAASGSVVFVTSPAFTTAVAQAASALQAETDPVWTAVAAVGYSGIVSNESTLATNVFYFHNGVVTNVVHNP